MWTYMDRRMVNGLTKVLKRGFLFDLIIVMENKFEQLVTRYRELGFDNQADGIIERIGSAKGGVEVK